MDYLSNRLTNINHHVKVSQNFGDSMYIKNVLIGLDQFLNSCLGGKPDETISAKLYRKSITTGKWYWKYSEKFVNAIFFDKDHCYQSFLSEVERKQFPNHYKNYGNKK
jgi:hypothetical protein